MKHLRRMIYPSFFPLFLVSLSLAIFSSCSKYAEYQVLEGQTLIRDVNLKVDNADIISWDFGILKSKAVLSKGFNVNLRFNPLEAEALTDLYRNKFVDSWLVVIKKVESSGRSRTVGHIYYPLVVKDKETDKLTTNLINSFSFSVYYDAAALFQGDMFSMKCPPEGLKKSIEQLEVKETKDYDESAAELRVGLAQKISIRDDELFRSEFLALVMPAGNSLEGEYRISIALYNEKDKAVLSNFVEAKDVVVISKEVEKNVPEC